VGRHLSGPSLALYSTPLSQVTAGHNMTSNAAQRSLLPMLSMTPSHCAVLAPSAPPKAKQSLSCSVEPAPSNDSPTGALTPVAAAAVQPQRSQFSPPSSLDEVPESRVARAHAPGLFDSDDEDFWLSLRAMFPEDDSVAVAQVCVARGERVGCSDPVKEQDRPSLRGAHGGWGPWSLG
jgi:hypothetical protein